MFQATVSTKDGMSNVEIQGCDWALRTLRNASQLEPKLAIPEVREVLRWRKHGGLGVRPQSQKYLVEVDQAIQSAYNSLLQRCSSAYPHTADFCRITLGDRFSIDAAQHTLDQLLNSVKHSGMSDGGRCAQPREAVDPIRLGNEERAAVQEVSAEGKRRRQRPQPHPDPEALLGGKDSVTYQTAASVLAVGDRQIRRLVQQGALQTVGEGQNRKITSESLRRYGGLAIKSDTDGTPRT